MKNKNKIIKDFKAVKFVREVRDKITNNYLASSILSRLIANFLFE